MAKKKRKSSKRIGRPPTDNPQLVRTVRFTNDDFELVEQAAESTGVTVSQFIRDATVAAARRKTR